MAVLPQSRIKQLRALKQRKFRDELGLFVGEGPLVIDEAFRAGVQPQLVVVCDELVEGSRDKIDAALAACGAAGVEVFEAAKADFLEGADTVNSQGLLAVFSTPVWNLDKLLQREFLTLLVLDNLRDPGNLGTIVRQAAAFDCDGLLLLKGCVDAYNHKAVRASMGGLFHVPIVSELSPEEVMQRLGAAGVWPYVTSTKGSNAFAVTFPPRTAFIIGGESEGVQPFWSERDVINVGIPQSSKVESLNAAAAASIFLAYRYQNRPGGPSSGRR
jgi:TrmH family RNA methyltransferase